MKRLIFFGIFLMFTLSINLFADGIQPPGSGNSVNPYQVSILDHLLWLSTNTSSWNKYFEQTADIDANPTSGWNGGAGFSPIGNNTLKFTGTYDGQGHTIDGLYIYAGEGDGIGFVGYTYGASIENIGVMNIDFFGDYYVGGLVGRHSHNSSISNSFATGSLTGDDFVGGLAGTQYDSSITGTSFASVAVTGWGDRIGGLIGNSDSSIIINCYATGSVTGTSWHRIGGLIGWNNVSSTVTNCYSIGSVSPGGDWTGGLVGWNDGTVGNSFWDIYTSNRTTSNGGTGKTTIQMKNVRTFTDVGWSAGLNSPWDFVTNPYDDVSSDDIWNMDGFRFNNGYPFLSWQLSEEPPDAPTIIVITITEDNVELDWNSVPGATSYKVYSDSDPYGGFGTTEWTGAVSEWSETIPGDMKYYRVTALND
ncbi:MAG: hypothetical protein H8E57_05640 [Candidatus Cloacimonetes bacterium]|nr:hypothetical protein [Candidatus Cloacimonadota bacterium]